MPLFPLDRDRQDRSADGAFFFCLRYPADPGCARIAMVGELDVGAAPLGRDALRMAQNSARSVVCDMEDVSFIDIRGLRVLLEATEHARITGARLTIVHAPEIVLSLAASLGLDGELASA